MNSTDSLTAAEAKAAILNHPWSAPITIVLRDGTERTGTLKVRTRRAFNLDDSIWAISYGDVAEIRSHA